MNRSEVDFYCQNDKTYRVSSDLCGNHEEVCESLRIDISATVQGSSSQNAEIDHVQLAMTEAIRSQEAYGNGIGGKSVRLYRVLPTMGGAKSLLGTAKYDLRGELPIERLDNNGEFLLVTTEDGSTFQIHCDHLRIEMKED